LTRLFILTRGINLAGDKKMTRLAVLTRGRGLRRVELYASHAIEADCNSITSPSIFNPSKTLQPRRLDLWNLLLNDIIDASLRVRC